MRGHSLLTYAGLGLALACVSGVHPGSAAAQTMGYGGLGGEDAAGPGATSGNGASGAGPSGGAQGEKATGGRRVDIRPYIELDQIVSAQLSPGSDVLTYTQAAVGVDAGLQGRRTGLSLSARYARQIGWGDARDSDILSGVARGYATVTPGLTLEAGGLATQSSFSGGSARYLGGDDRRTVYSVYAGPTLATRAGAVDLQGSYRAGYSRVEQGNAFLPAPDGERVTRSEESVVQSVELQAGVKPGTVLPVGLAVAGSAYQEDISVLDQRVRDMQARAMVTLPVSRTVQVVGAIGYEDVEISNRDVVYDAEDRPVIGRDGQYVTDKSSPRQLSYDVSGILWDVAVMWRPSRRTSFSAHVGRRYGSTTFGGQLAYSPDDRKTLSVSVYDNLAGFGGQINRALNDLPTDFEAVRDPVTGDLVGCVNSLEGSNCLPGVLGALRASAFRARGIAASYTMQIGRLSAGIGLGYDRRKYIAAQGTILASADGMIDENTWASLYLSGPLGRNAGWSTNGYVNWITSTDTTFGDVTTYGLAASYYHMITPRLRGSLAVSVDGSSYDLDTVRDYWSLTGLAGLRYNF